MVRLALALFAVALLTVVVVWHLVARMAELL